MRRSKPVATNKMGNDRGMSPLICLRWISQSCPHCLIGAVIRSRNSARPASNAQQVFCVVEHSECSVETDSIHLVAPSGHMLNRSRRFHYVFTKLLHLINKCIEIRVAQRGQHNRGAMLTISTDRLK